MKNINACSLTLQQFHSLPELEQLAAIMQHGRLLAQSIEDECRVFLYQFDSFYVTTRYQSADDQLAEIQCFLEVKEAVPHFRKRLISMHPASRAYATPDR